MLNWKNASKTKKENMLVELLYPIAIIVLLVDIVAIIAITSFWWTYWVRELPDRMLFWIVDKLMGCKGEQRDGSKQ